MPPRSRLLSLLFVLVVCAAQPSGIALGAEGAYSSAQPRPSAIVKQAFDLLMDRFVEERDSAEILRGGWEAGASALRARATEDIPDTPELGAGREADWRSFQARYGRLAEVAEEKLDRPTLDRIIVDGMARSLNEGHTYFMSPDDYRRVQAQINNRDRYGGVGVRVNEERKVMEVFDDSPAASGGIRPGDQIVAVDGDPADGLTPLDLSARIRGEPGTTVELTIRRDGEPDRVLKLVRAQVRVGWISSRILDGGVGYLLIRTFPIPTALEEFRKAIARFDEADIRALVIDVRGNGGGSVDTGVEIASTFIKTGPIYQQVDRRGGRRTVTAFGDYWERTVPIAILVDGGSGSMSEIFASAMQERGVATVFGTKTAGNVAGATYHPLSDGSGLAVTNLLITSGEGKKLNGIGLEPNQMIELDPRSLSSSMDNQLTAAVSYVRKEAAARANETTPQLEVKGYGRLHTLPSAA